MKPRKTIVLAAAALLAAALAGCSSSPSASSIPVVVSGDQVTVDAGEGGTVDALAAIEKFSDVPDQDNPTVRVCYGGEEVRLENIGEMSWFGSFDDQYVSEDKKSFVIPAGLGDNDAIYAVLEDEDGETFTFDFGGYNCK